MVSWSLSLYAEDSKETHSCFSCGCLLLPLRLPNVKQASVLVIAFLCLAFVGVLQAMQQRGVSQCTRIMRPRLFSLQDAGRYNSATASTAVAYLTASENSFSNADGTIIDRATVTIARGMIGKHTHTLFVINQHARTLQHGAGVGVEASCWKSLLNSEMCRKCLPLPHATALMLRRLLFYQSLILSQRHKHSMLHFLVHSMPQCDLDGRIHFRVASP